MHLDEDNLLDLHVSHYYVHVTEPQRIIQLSEENRSSESISQYHASKIKQLCDDSLDGINHDMEIKNIESIVEDQQNSMHSLNLLNNMHPQVRQFIKYNFGGSGLELVPVELFTNYLIKQFQTMFNYSDIEGIRVRLLDYFKIKMGGGLIDMEKLSAVTKNNGLIGFVSKFIASIQFQSNNSNPHQQQPVPLKIIENSISDSKKQIENFQSIIKGFAQKLFYTLQKQLQARLNQQMNRITDRYNVALTMLYKVQKKADIIDNKKYRKQIETLNKQISELQDKILSKQKIIVTSQQHIDKLNQENVSYKQKIDKLNDHIKLLQMPRYPSIPHAIPSPSNHNNSFDKGKLEQMFMCSTPKSQKSRLVLIPQLGHKNRSQSSANLDILNITCLSARQNPQQVYQHRRLKTQDEHKANTSRQNRNQSIKKSSQMMCPKTRPTKIVINSTKKNTWKV